MQVPAPRPGFARRLGAIAAGGLALRLLYVLVLTPHLRGLGDATYYHQLANVLADGRGFVDPGNGTATALHPPLFPLVLAPFAKLGAGGYLAQRVVVSALGACTIAVAGLVARRLAGERAGLIAAGLAALSPVLVSADGAVMSETLLGLLVALCALAAYRLLERPSPARAALLGAGIGLAALTRGEALLLLPLLALPVALRLPERSAAALGAAVLACLVVLAPWTVRNLATFERPVPISTNEGGLIAGANCPGTYRGRDIGSWDIRCVPQAPIAEESIAAARFRRAGLDYARDHAGRLPLVEAARLGRTFELLQPIRQAHHGEGRAAGLEVAGAIWFLLLVPLGAYGALVLRRRRLALSPLVAPFGLAIGATLVGYGVPRFRHPADVALLVLVAVAADALARRRAGEGEGEAAAAQAPPETPEGSAGAGSDVASPRSTRSGARTSRFSRSAGRSTA
jgi:4-amino-4-deoxy-L-arabinose transferase-like glycosyltransferase